MEGKKLIEGKIEECHRVVESVIGIVTSTMRHCAKELELEASGELMDREEPEESSDDDSNNDDDDDDDNNNENGDEKIKEGVGKKKKKNLNSNEKKNHKKSKKKKKKKKKFSFKKTTSIAKQKEAHQRRVVALRHAQAETELITNFVRLVDTYQVIILAQRGVETTHCLMIELSRDDRLQGLFETSVRFVNDSEIASDAADPAADHPDHPADSNPDMSQMTIQFEPTVSIVTQSLNALISNTISAFDDVSRLLRVRVQSVARRLRHIVRDPMKVSDIVLEKSPNFTKTILKITTLIENDFMKAKEYAKTFEVVKPIYQFEKGTFFVYLLFFGFGF